MPARMYYDNDADASALDGQTVAVRLNFVNVRVRRRRGCHRGRHGEATDSRDLRTSSIQDASNIGSLILGTADYSSMGCTQ